MKILCSLLLGASLTVIAVQAQENGRSAQDESLKNSSAQSVTATAQNTSDKEYKIGPQDVLRIDVWKEPEITRTVPVRPDGKITLPLLNDIQAAGMTPMELANVIHEGLKKYINDPQVTVSVEEINSRRIYVTGEVTRPGAFPLLPNMTVLQALTSAGGFTQFAKMKNIYVLRTESGKQLKLPFNYKAVIDGKKPADNIQLQAGDTIVVP
ncbi:MAG: polysaccharide biosynthesis/export family protein [Candidatus Acidiferrum sp.]